MQHEDVWRALDTLAAEKGLTPSGLARAAGLDPTTFNRSKRRGRAGLRWPSTESLSRVLHATGASLEAFTALVGGARALTTGRHHRGLRHLPMLPLSRLGEADLFDGTGHPVRENWEEADAPLPADLHAYAVRVDGRQFEPMFRENGILILSVDAAHRPGDRLLVYPGGGEPVAAGIMAADGARPRIEIGCGAERVVLQTDAAERCHRIAWASF